jgi:hypothetical protein
VIGGVRSTTELRGLEGGDADNEEEPGRRKDQLRHLQKWTKNRNPLDYGDNAYYNLVRALSVTSAEIANGLPGLETNKLSFRSFATKLYEMGRPNSPMPASAPILPKGSFLAVLKVAIHFLEDLNKSESEDTANFVISILAIAADKCRIRFIPWAQHHSGRGRQARQPHWKNWAHINLPSPIDQIPVALLRPEDVVTAAAIDAQKAAQDADVNAEWATDDYPLCKLDIIVTRMKLPSDWEIPERMKEGYIAETYRWYQEHYDASITVHHLALIISIIAAQLVPKLFMPTNTEKRFEKATTRSETQEIARKIPWTAKRHRYGVSNKAKFVTMLATFIAAIYTPTSPLRNYMKAHNNAMGPWAAFHGESHFCVKM